MMDFSNYKDCIIVTKNNRGITLRATKITVENTDKLLCVFDGDNVIAIFQLSEIKAVIFAYMSESSAMDMLNILTDKVEV